MTKGPFHAVANSLSSYTAFPPVLDDDIAENIQRWACMMGCASRKADASLSSLKTLHLIHASKHCSQNGDSGFGDLEPGLSRGGGGVTLPLHPPLSTTRAGNPRGSHGFSPLGLRIYSRLRISTPKKAQFLFLQRLQSATPTDYVGGQPPKLGLCTVTSVGRQRPAVFSKKVSPSDTKDEKFNSL